MEYQILDTATVVDYLRGRSLDKSRIDLTQVARVEEIGDGNLNLVFRVMDRGGRSVIVKQALPYVRLVGEDWPMTPERSIFEMRSLALHGQACPGHVVAVLDEDPDQFTFVMEDLRDSVVWRKQLISGMVEPEFAKQMGRYVAAIALETSFLGLERKVLEHQRAQFHDPDLCEITEDLVFTEPIFDIGRNYVTDGNLQDYQDFREDPNVLRLNAAAKWAFVSKSEALIHGDLHTGSVFVTQHEQDSGVDPVAKAFDSEFAFYGPIGFDLGALIANYVISAARSYALGEPELVHAKLGLISATLDTFVDELTSQWTRKVDDPLFKQPTVRDELIASWCLDAWRFAACKMSRRVVGVARTADIESLPSYQRELANRMVLGVAREIARIFAEEPAPLEHLFAAVTRHFDGS